LGKSTEKGIVVKPDPLERQAQPAAGGVAVNADKLAVAGGADTSADRLTAVGVSAGSTR
jgi:hypothetical protein